ncbi:MAG: efflux RND transporter periplasmic adaptor subunit [Eubacterium sp.]|nr:efflux RND transporter periplasmic adaptor subunit [Eubacterium sp.]
MKDKILNFLKRHKKGLIILAVLVVVIFVILPKVIGNKANEMLEGMYQTEKPTVQDLQKTLTGTGTIAPNDQYAIISMVQGEITDAPFEAGDIVEKGQLLYQFSTENAEDAVQSAELGVRQAQQSYEDAVDAQAQSKDNLSLTSDQEGYVKKLYVSAGDKIAAGSKIADVYDNTTMTLEVPFNAAEVQRTWIGNRATVYVGDESERLKGTVTAISPTTETLSGNMVVTYVTIELVNPGAISAGMSGTASIGGVDCNSEGIFAVKSEGTILADGSGTIEKLKLKEGSYVHKGDTYIVLKDASVGDTVASSALSLESAENQLSSAEKKLDDYSITAPISGTVITKNAKEGDNINATYANPLAVIYDLSKVKFQMKVDELDVLKIYVGQEVKVTADALENVEMTGHITNISLEAITTGGVTEYPVTVEMDAVGDLLPGMNVSATIVLEEEKNALCIPVDALMRGDVVYVKNEEGQETDADAIAAGVPAGFHEVTVEVGLSSDSYVQILSGLKETDEVYVPRAELTDMYSLMMGGPPMEEDEE